MKLLFKSTLVLFTTALLSQAFAKTTICYKKDWNSPATIEVEKLEGGECKGELSYRDMLKNGWFLKDIKIEKGKDGLNYIYTLTDKRVVEIDNATILKNEYKKLDYRPFAIKILNVTDETATINVGNLRVGQSGIVQHYYEDNKTLIVSNAYVTSSNETASTLKFFPFTDLKQNAIPTSNRKPVTGDVIIMNYMYDSSLIIAPSQDAFSATREKYKDNNFLHSDLFAAKLKSEGIPTPPKEVIQEYAISQNLGTIFFIIDNTIYVVDSKTFAILDKDIISYNYIENKRMPFYTRVEKIEKNIFTSMLDYKSWFGFLNKIFGDDTRSEDERLLENEIAAGELTVKGEVYNNYYETMLGIKK
ncbi:hypothetical protein CRV08_13700 [Halarcobacter ebronensis]|uniref:Plasminogen-binding protein PgbA N-terminal domain-containing protein n=1 Tax=Halarcobacter ebronensis TaxID=1462615 RepID=A0A4Q0Y8L1_9BACT|nr:plasminogen-binding N-terminal domain-containing protein [Halarcobacter ebronensis]RXJ66223.1 hypothetical protein CRV08_13700 [Halarcobacter ebronensis]